MNSKKLSKRLKAVAQYVPQGSYLADIGSDHAYLPVYLVKNGIIECGIASEVAKGPYHNLRIELMNERMHNKLISRLDDGLDAIHNEPVNVITIAGMGGNLICDILHKGQNKLNNDCRLILQPNVGEMTLRKYLMNNNYKITNENIISEDNHIYEIIVAVKSTERINYSTDELFFGPILLKYKSSIFLEKWNNYIKWITNVINQMKQAKKNVPVNKINSLRRKANHIKEVLKNES